MNSALGTLCQMQWKKGGWLSAEGYNRIGNALALGSGGQPIPDGVDRGVWLAAVGPNILPGWRHYVVGLSLPDSSR